MYLLWLMGEYFMQEGVAEKVQMYNTLCSGMKRHPLSICNKPSHLFCILLEECKLIPGVLTENNGHKKTALFLATSILLVLSTGAIIFFWRRARAKALSVNKSGYEKLPDQTKSFQSFKNNRESTSSFQRDHVIEYHDREEEEEDDDDEDIVYMGQDGTVYRKFKYGLLEDDDDEDLEYDDESYSFR